MRSKIKQWINSVSFLLYIQIFTLCIFFSYVTYKSIQINIDNFIKRTEFRLNIIEKSVESLFDNASQVIFSVSLLISKEKIKTDNYKIFEVLNSFDTKFSKHKNLPFTTFKVFNTFGDIISSSALSENICTTRNKNLDLTILKYLKIKPYDIQKGIIECEEIFNIEFIPFCTSINSGNTQKGFICSGLKMKEINIMLNEMLSTEDSSKIKIVSRSSVDKFQPMKESFNIKNVLSYYLNNKSIYAHKLMPSYPEIVIEIKANFYYLMRDIIFNNIYFMIYFIFSIIFSIFIYYKKNNSNKIILSSIFEKLMCFPENVTQHFSNKYMLPKEKEILEAINSIMDYALYLHENKKNELEEIPAIAIRNNILHLILTERHYSRNIVTKTSLSTLYLGQMKKLITSAYTTENLYNFLQQTSEYCREYFDELNIQIKINKKDYKDFTYRSAALIESIFNIFSLITRSSNFETEENEIILKGTFDLDNHFPTISIETFIQTSSIKSLGWESGPVYVYSGFLAVHLLAKENNLILNIFEDKNGEKVVFSLQPISEKEMIEKDNLVLNLC